MSDKTASNIKITELKRKLETAIESRAELEDDLKYQTSLLTHFITKLSLVAKGIDVKLDNKLAKLRNLLSKSASIVDIEKSITEISQLLQKHSILNEKQIRQMHDQFHSSAASLQKINGLPDKLRRELRTLLKESEETKDALIQYVPILNQLIIFYQNALKAKSNISAGGLLSATPQSSNSTDKSEANKIDKEVLQRFSQFLNKLTVSTKYRKNISKIKADLTIDMPNDKLLNSFLEVFEVISKDLVQERNTAKVFLSTLSETLSTVQTAVSSTISSNNACKDKHNQLNQQLQKQISEMASGLDKANSLADIKEDINVKLKNIAGTLKEKTSFEYTQQQLLETQLTEMKKQVDTLEEQSKTFEKRIQEQQAKSMQDALTKLDNRAAFDDYFAKEIVRYHHSNFDLAIVVIDLDDFKRINDTYGHTAGDKTLQVIANTLKKQMDKDIFVGRYGGEEFVLIFSNINKGALMKKLESLRAKVASLPFTFKSNKVSITLSMGASHIKNDDNVHIAFERADTALYQAKEKGKNNVVYI